MNAIERLQAENDLLKNAVREVEELNGFDYATMPELVRMEIQASTLATVRRVLARLNEGRPA